MEAIRELMIWILAAGGAVFCVTGALGLLRLPDVYARMHAGGLVDTLGAALILTALMLEASHWTSVVKLIGILFFLYVTTSTATHALAHAAYASGLEPVQAAEAVDETVAGGSEA